MTDPPKGLSEQDKALWQKVTDSVTVKQPPAKTLKPKPPQPVNQSRISARTIPPAAEKFIQPAKANRVGVIGSPTKLPLLKYSRKEKSRLSRGIIKIDGTLDLHGFTQAHAYLALQNFIFFANKNQWKHTLVITGKGRSQISDCNVSEDDYFSAHPGILRRAVPIWLSQEPLLAFIAGFDEAGKLHGGSGALFVRLRKNKKTKS